MNRQQMMKKISSLTSLPTLPVVAMEVNRMLQDLESPIERLVELLERDQAMVMKILRLVNSSFFGLKNRVTSLRHAVTLLGYSTVQSAVVTVSVIDVLTMKHKQPGFDIGDFWTHAIGVAVMTRQLAERTRLAQADEAFTAGLLHDVGKIVLVNHFPDIFSRVLAQMDTGQETFFAAEQHLGCWPHTRIGGYLANRWMLPEKLEQSISRHHSQTNGIETFNTITLVRLADTLVNLMENRRGYHLDPNLLSETVREPVVALLKDSQEWFPVVKTEIDEASNFFKQG